MANNSGEIRLLTGAFEEVDNISIIEYYKPWLIHWALEPLRYNLHDVLVLVSMP